MKPWALFMEPRVVLVELYKEPWKKFMEDKHFRGGTIMNIYGTMVNFDRIVNNASRTMYNAYETKYNGTWYRPINCYMFWTYSW